MPMLVHRLDGLLRSDDEPLRSEDPTVPWGAWVVVDGMAEALSRRAYILPGTPILSVSTLPEHVHGHCPVQMTQKRFQLASTCAWAPELAHAGVGRWVSTPGAGSPALTATTTRRCCPLMSWWRVPQVPSIAYWPVEGWQQIFALPVRSWMYPFLAWIPRMTA